MTAIVVDTSAIIAIVRNEPEKDRFTDVILGATPGFISAVSLQEAYMVLAGHDGTEDRWSTLPELIAALGLEIVPHDAASARAAGQAFLRFGKGRHRARLNFGDRASYAMAKAHGLKLLFKGGDFPETDVEPAV